MHIVSSRFDLDLATRPRKWCNYLFYLSYGKMVQLGWGLAFPDEDLATLEKITRFVLIFIMFYDSIDLKLLFYP